jgi:type IV pilus assembly protein PilY1
MTSTSYKPRHVVRLAVCAVLLTFGHQARPAPLSLAESPLFVASGLKPNVMLTIANSNSMDEDATGLAVGSAAPNSRSEIARRVAKNLIADYGGSLNMGLMAFQQNVAGFDSVRNRFLHSSPYDVSFDPANFDPSYTGDRDSPTKRFRAPNRSWPGHFIYYNVNLPFYSNRDEEFGVCYSIDGADAFGSTNPAELNYSHPTLGPWNDYRCFQEKQSASNVLPLTAAVEAAEGWGSYTNTYKFAPTDSDLGQGIVDFGRYIAWDYVSETWFSNSSPGGGYVHQPIAAVTAAHAAVMNTKLGTSQFVTNEPVNPAFPLQNAGLTPLEGTLYTIRDYFKGNLNDTARGGPLPAPPNSCKKDFSVVLTNGLPSVTQFGVASADVTTMLADATTAAASVKAAGVLNYVVGFALPFGVNPAQLDTIAAAGGTTASYYATDEASLNAQLNTVLNDIIARSGAAGAVALNDGSANANSRIYQARFNTGDWSGQLLSLPINPTTGAVGGAVWDAGVRLNGQNWDTSRRILTYNPTVGARRGVAFRWPANAAAPANSELSVAQVSALNASPSGVADGLGSSRLQYLRGDASNEGNGVGDFRRRLVSKLGDIVNSSPVYVRGPNQVRRETSYAAFKSAYGTRPEMVYVGANDGMLHGFDAVTGDEKIAYVPYAVFPRLSSLAGQGYSHRYMVDGSPVVADIEFSTGWRTLLVSGLGGGGRGLFALDVTDPATFGESNVAADRTVRWEFTALDDNDLGYTYAQPSIVKLNNGKPGVVVGNGYNNTGSGRAMLFIINAETGALIRKIDTGEGSPGDPNGLSTPAVIDQDGDGVYDYAYAGDLKGNMWKFDLSDSSDGSWDVAYGDPFYEAKSSAGVAQPITTTPIVSRHPNGGMMVMFGTGRYLQAADVGNTASQTMYGIRDNGDEVDDRADLQQQTVVDVETVSGVTYREVSKNSVDWGDDEGWYIDLPEAGERIIVDSIIRRGRLVVPTMTPNSDPCASGGSSWLMHIDYLTGGRLDQVTIDVNQDRSFNASDVVGFADGNRSASGLRYDSIVSTPAVIAGFDTASGPGEGGMEISYLNSSDSSATIGGVPYLNGSPSDPLANRRTSWRQIL